MGIYSHMERAPGTAAAASAPRPSVRVGPRLPAWSLAPVAALLVMAGVFSGLSYRRERAAEARARRDGPAAGWRVREAAQHLAAWEGRAERGRVVVGVAEVRALRSLLAGTDAATPHGASHPSPGAAALRAPTSPPAGSE